MKCASCGADSMVRSGGRLVCEYCRSVCSDEGPAGPVRSPERIVVHEVREIRYVNDTDRLGVGLGCLCWLVFPLAWIIWAVSIGNHPRRARTAFVIALVQTAFLATAVLAGMIDGGDGTSSASTVRDGIALCLDGPAPGCPC